MLSIGKIALGQHRYYEHQVAQGHDDYYAGRGEAPGEWVGTGAAALGLSGEVSGAQFGALLAGLYPRDPGVRLRASARDPKVAALDLTFSAPKSVSVLAAVAGDRVTRDLILAHEQAVRAALGWLEESAVQVRRGAGGERVERAGGLLAAAYRHRMSRALDPQLHTHVVAANLACGPDGRFTALHGTPLYRAAKTAGFLYQAHLRALVSERLGLEWGPVRNGAAELVGVDRLVLEEFSKRRFEMLREAERDGIGLGSKAAAESAALATRERHRYGVETHTWREEVRARAGELGLGARELGELTRVGRVRAAAGLARAGGVDERRLGDRLAGPEGLTERSNTFDERAVLQEFAAAATQGRDPGGKELFCELDHVAAGDAIAHRGRRHGRLQPGAEGARGHLGWQRGMRSRSALRAAHALGAVFDHPGRHLRQLFDLVARGRMRRPTLILGEDVAAGAALRPVLDHLIHSARRQQLAPVALVTGLATTFAPAGILAAPWRPAGGIGARRSGGVARVAVQLALELGDALILAGDTLLEAPYLLVHAQQHLDDHLAPGVVDRLRLSALHTPGFDAAGLCPPTH